MNRLKEIIKEKGIKQTFICEKLNIHPSVFSGYVKGTRKPSQKRLREISRILNTSIENIYPNCTKKRIFYYYI